MQGPFYQAAMALEQSIRKSLKHDADALKLIEGCLSMIYQLTAIVEQQHESIELLKKDVAQMRASSMP